MTSQTPIKPIIRHRTLRQLNSNANCGSKHPPTATKAKHTTPTDVSVYPVAKTPVPRPRQRLPSSQSSNLSPTSVQSELKFSTAKETEPTSSVLPGKMSKVNPLSSESHAQPVKPTVSPKPTKKKPSQVHLQQQKYLQTHQQHQEHK